MGFLDPNCCLRDFRHSTYPPLSVGCWDRLADASLLLESRPQRLSLRIRCCNCNAPSVAQNGARNVCRVSPGKSLIKDIKNKRRSPPVILHDTLSPAGQAAVPTCLGGTYVTSIRLGFCKVHASRPVILKAANWFIGVERCQSDPTGKLAA